MMSSPSREETPPLHSGRACRHAACLLLALCAQACSTEFIDPMEQQKKYLPYKENSFFTDGRAMRPLVEGTVPRERQLGDPLLRTGYRGDLPAERIPVPVRRELLELGRKHFDIRCAPCHGTLGDGDSVVASRMSLRPPPSLISGDAAAYPPGRVFRIITEGYGMMPSYAAEMSIEERWAAIAYVQALKLSQNAPLGAAPPEVQQRLLREPR